MPGCSFSPIFTVPPYTSFIFTVAAASFLTPVYLSVTDISAVGGVVSIPFITSLTEVSFPAVSFTVMLVSVFSETVTSNAPFVKSPIVTALLLQLAFKSLSRLSVT